MTILHWPAFFVLRGSLFDQANSQHVLLIIDFVHFRLNVISPTNEAPHFGRVIDREMNLLPVKAFDDNANAFNAQYFTLDGLDLLPCFCSTVHAAWDFHCWGSGWRASSITSGNCERFGAAIIPSWGSRWRDATAGRWWLTRGC